MGHVRLGTLPDTAPWRRVVGLIAEDTVAQVATATTQAALRGLALARDDDGLIHSVWLLSQVAFAARQPDFADALGEADIFVAAEPTVLDLACGFSAAVDRHLRLTAGRTDIGELAQLAAVEALAGLLGQRASTLFGTTPEDVRRAARELSTRQGFATLAHDFFARFVQRFLTFHLGRELSQHVGGNGRFADPAAHNAFVAELEVHCREVAGVVRDFAGGWYAKAHLEGGITPVKARNFTRYALTKLEGELLIRGERDG